MVVKWANSWAQWLILGYKHDEFYVNKSARILMTVSVLDNKIF